VHIGRPGIRGFRALVFAVACVAVSAGLHGVAGGGLISSGAFAAAVTAVAPGAYLLGGRQRSLPVLLIACAATQSSLHVWFTAISGHAHHLVPGPSMLLVHLLAMAVCAVWLARGDAALAALLEHLVLLAAPALLARLLEAAGPARAPRRPAGAPARVSLRLLLLAAAASRRGPPAFALSH
jgi:hypothetical protein